MSYFELKEIKMLRFFWTNLILLLFDWFSFLLIRQSGPENFWIYSFASLYTFSNMYFYDTKQKDVCSFIHSIRSRLYGAFHFKKRSYSMIIVRPSVTPMRKWELLSCYLVKTSDFFLSTFPSLWGILDYIIFIAAFFY